MTGLQRIRTLLPILLLAALATSTSSSWAQGIITDRPDFTESAVTVPVGVLQIEAGGTFTSLSGELSETVIGEALLRWGIRPRVEIRVGPPSFASISNGDTHSGLTDGSIGAKVQLGPFGDGWDVAAIGTLSMPIGDDEFSSGEVDPAFIFTGGRAINESVGIGGQVMASWPTVGDDREFEWGGTVVVSSSIGPKTGAFLELAATVPESGTAPVVGHTGIVYGVSETFQLDFHAGVGITDTAPDAFIGIGLAGQL